MKEGSKYYPLYEYLRQKDERTAVLTLAQIEDLIGQALPRSAKKNRGWWSNRSSGALQSQAWMQAGFNVTAVSLTTGTITFEKPKLVYEVRQIGGHVQWTGDLVHGLRRHMNWTQEELADELGVRQQTVSEWEREAYAPSRSTSKYLSLVAERAGFTYKVEPK